MISSISRSAAGGPVRTPGRPFVRALGLAPDAGGTQRFEDVPPGHIFYGYIQIFGQLGITGGCTATRFCPDAVATRGQMAVFVNRALGILPRRT